MNILNLEKVNKICNERKVIMSALESINLQDGEIIVTVPKSSTGPGAQFHMILMPDELEYLKGILKARIDDFNYQLKKLGVINV